MKRFRLEPKTRTIARVQYYAADRLVRMLVNSARFESAIADAMHNALVEGHGVMKVRWKAAKKEALGEIGKGLTKKKEHAKIKNRKDRHARTPKKDG